MEEKKSMEVPESCDINLSDFALFLSVMKNKEAYECVLSIIMDEDDLELQEVKVEQVVLNQTGKRAIRMDAWALDKKYRQFNMEMQNDTNSDDLSKRSRFYQGMMDTPVLKAGKMTKYKQLPVTVIIFITQDDIFGRNLARYTFEEECRELPGLFLGDGTQKIFLNMSSQNGRAELVSLLQYMKDTRLNNPNVSVQDQRLLKLDEIVTEVRQSEEWEAIRMNLIEIGMEKGREEGREEGIRLSLEVCQDIGVTRELAKEKLIQKFELSEEKVEEYLDLYWNQKEA